MKNDLKMKMKTKNSKKLFVKNEKITKTTKFTQLVKNYKGFFQNKKKIITKKKNENDINESIFFKKMKEMMSSSLKIEGVIKYFKKERSLRAEIETRSVGDFLSNDKKNVFFYNLRKISKGKLYTLIHCLSLEYYKKDDLIFQYKEPLNRFDILLQGTIYLYLPYFIKKNITVKEFLSYLFYIKKNSPKSFIRVEKKNENLYDGIYKLKVNDYNLSCISEEEQEKRQDFFIEEYQNVYNIDEGNQVNQISILYNLVQNFNGYAKNDVYILSLNRYEFMNILRICLEEELSKEFIRIRKYCYIFNSWTNYSLAQIMNYYIPFKLINEEFLYQQREESDSFYIIQEGIFEVYCEISLSEFSQYRKYILKDNKNVIDWMREEKENKVKISVEKIIDYIQWKVKKEEYREEKEDLDKNMIYIKKSLLNKGVENDEQLINLKVNEEIFKEKNKKLKIKLFTLQKNDYIGLEDSLDLKSRYYYVKCISEKGVLNKVRILDFIVFIASNHGLDLQNITNYVKERKNTIIERIYNNLSQELNNSKRTINHAYSLALSSYEKRKKLSVKNKTENIYKINYMKNLNINNNNFFEKIQQLNQINKKASNLTQFQDIKLQRKKSSSIRKNFPFNQMTNNNEEKKSSMSKLHWNFGDENDKTYIREKRENILRNKIKAQPSISIHLLTTTTSTDRKNKNKKKRIIDINRILTADNMNNNNNSSKKTVFKYNLTSTTLGDQYNYIKNREVSYNSKLDKEIINFTGIYNTKRELSKKKVILPSKKEEKKINRHTYSNYRLSHSNYMNRRKNVMPLVAILSITEMNDEAKKIQENNIKRINNLRKHKNLKLKNQ